MTIELVVREYGLYTFCVTLQAVEIGVQNAGADSGAAGGSGGSAEPLKVKRKYFYHALSCEKDLLNNSSNY